MKAPPYHVLHGQNLTGSTLEPARILSELASWAWTYQVFTALASTEPRPTEPQESCRRLRDRVLQLPRAKRYIRIRARLRRRGRACGVQVQSEKGHDVAAQMPNARQSTSPSR